MELNKVVKGVVEKQLNPEGAIVFKENIYRDAILAGANFNLRQKRTYFEPNEQFNNFVELITELWNRDKEFVIKLANFLAKSQGRKTSPAVIFGIIASIIRKEYDNGNATHLRDILDWDTEIMLFQRVNSNTLKTPKQMAEMLATFNILTGQSIKKVPPFIKRMLKRTFEEYDRTTLIKNRLRRRSIKTADLIKVLRPKPKTKEMAELYKAIIENRVKLTEQDKQIHLTSVMSDTTISKEEKQQILEDSIERMPINMLIRNLRKFKDSSFDVKQRIYNRFKDILEAIKRGDERALRIFNPFTLMDIFTIPEKELLEFGAIVDVIDSILEEYFRYLRDEVNVLGDNQNIAILIDQSGSMYGTLDMVAHYLKMMVFAIKLAKSKENLLGIGKFHVEYIGDYIENAQELVNRKPSYIFKELFNNYRPGYGTNIPDSLVQFYDDIIKRTGKKPDVIFLITDEVSWYGTDNVTKQVEKAMNNLKANGLPLIFIYNPVHTAKQGVTFKKNIVKVSNLSNNIPLYLQLYTNIDEFVKYIKDNF